MQICDECGGSSEFELSACQGAIDQQYHYDLTYTGTDTTHVISCNCCKNCRERRHQSFLESVEEGDQD